jgi:hypothetical protein
MTGYFPKYDIPAPDFLKDLEFGEQGEEIINKFIQDIASGHIEVKTDRYRNGKMVVETQQWPGRRRDADGNELWVLSGINVTTAKWWVYQYHFDGAFVVVATDRIKRYLRKNLSTMEKTVFAASSDNPAKGYLLSPAQVSELMLSDKYDL